MRHIGKVRNPSCSLLSGKQIFKPVGKTDQSIHITRCPAAHVIDLLFRCEKKPLHKPGQCLLCPLPDLLPLFFKRFVHRGRVLAPLLAAGSGPREVLQAVRILRSAAAAQQTLHIRQVILHRLPVMIRPPRYAAQGDSLEKTRTNLLKLHADHAGHFLHPRASVCLLPVQVGAPVPPHSRKLMGHGEIIKVQDQPFQRFICPSRRIEAGEIRKRPVCLVGSIRFFLDHLRNHL